MTKQQTQMIEQRISDARSTALAHEVTDLVVEVRSLNASSPPGEHINGVELQARQLSSGSIPR